MKYSYFSLILVLLSLVATRTYGQKFSDRLKADLIRLPTTAPIHFSIKVRQVDAFDSLVRQHAGEINIESTSVAFNIINVECTLSFVQKYLLGNANVQFIENGARRPKTESLLTGYDNSLNSLNKVQVAFPDLNGRGLVVSIKEDMFDSTDPDLKGRTEPTSVNSTIISSHANDMATVIAGGGNTFHTDRGAAWGATITSANFINLTTKTTAENRAVFVSSPGSHPTFNAAISDSNGMLRFDMKDFYHNGELIIRPERSADSTLTIQIQSPFSNTWSDRPLSYFSFVHMDSAALAEYYKDIVVQGEYLGSRLGKFLLPAVDTLAFFGKPDITYLLDDYVRFTTMEEVLREYVAQTSVRTRAGQFEVSILDRRRDQTFLEPSPLVLLDGVPTDINKVMSYDPLKVKRLDIVTEKYYYGNMAFGGILSFETYTGDLPGFDLDPHSVVLDYPGLEAQREFYCPRYDTKEELESRLPDFRRLLYWQPTIVTNQEGGSAQSFFTSDLPGKYVMVVQGVSPNGRLGYAIKEFTVR